ncbi:gamma-glutamylcyclotransferase family protein [Rhodospirillaceae bacterium SYSU D60014]|uniref:gamma-glutamylcyclotransferase family protein n=1 Tax=Virgifigura deserti TaxID=2268457 RepID=UPI0013C500A6
MRMFFFGSLMDLDLLRLVVGRDIGDLVFTPAAILGFERRRACDESFPIIMPHPGGQVDGFLVDGLTTADIDRIQFYESDDYALRTFTVATATSRVEAEVFLPTEKLADEGIVWEFDTWLEVEKPMCLALAEELMSHYGILTSKQYDLLWPDMKERAWQRFFGPAAGRKHAVGED